MKETALTQILQLDKMSIKQLQERYAELFGSNTGAVNNRIYIVRKIAFKIQEKEYGGISGEAKNRLEELIKEYDPINNITKIYHQTETVKIKRDRRLPMPGSVITKEYKGNEYNIKVLDKGFEYNGKRYGTLSAVAEAMTGAHWNGYAFFGFR